MYTLCMPLKSEIFTLQEISLPYLSLTQHRGKCTQDFTTMHHAVHTNGAQIVF